MNKAVQVVLHPIGFPFLGDTQLAPTDQFTPSVGVKFEHVQKSQDERSEAVVITVVMLDQVGNHSFLRTQSANRQATVKPAYQPLLASNKVDALQARCMRIVDHIVGRAYHPQGGGKVGGGVELAAAGPPVLDRGIRRGSPIAGHGRNRPCRDRTG